MGAPQYEQAGADIGGSGTTNTIPRWTGPSTLGDSGLIDDGSQIYTTSRVLAVNTATTLGTGLIRFQVGSASALANYQGAQAGFMLPTGSGSWVEFCENSASGTTFRISKDASTGVVLNANGKNMGFNASGYTTAVASSQMVLLTSGYVGIGTASPSYKLDVVSAEVRIGASAPGANTFLYLGNGVTSAGPYGVGALQFSGQAHTAVFANSGYGAARASLGMVSGGVYTPALSADPSGNVGIGTASPSTRLHVLASAAPIATFASSSATQGYIQLNYNTSTTFGYIGNGASVSGGAVGDLGIRSDTGVISFATGGSIERARIDSNGNIYGTSGTTGMTNGFFYIPAAAGAPTGVPTAAAGRVPMYYDTTNNQFYVYNGAWKKVTLA